MEDLSIIKIHYHHDSQAGGNLGETRTAARGQMGSGKQDRTEQRQEIIDLLRSLGAESQRLSEAFAQAQQLHPTDLRALLAVMHAENRDDPLTPGRLGEQLGLSSGAVTAVIDRLEQAGHLSRSRDGSDRRVVHLHYDPKAMEVARQFFGPLGERSHAVMDCFSPDELSIVAKFLGAMVKAISDFRRDLEARPRSGAPAQAEVGRAYGEAGERSGPQTS
jgi:DNA-binding MarR family transcriptional regulator